MRDFRFTDDQRAFQAAVRDYLAEECTPDDVRTAAETGELDDARWQGLAELGVVGLTVPEEHGGLGMSLLDLVLLLEEAGYAALPEPLLEVTAVTVPLLAAVGGEAAEGLLPAVAAGERRPVAVTEDIQPHATTADGYLVWHHTGDLVFASEVLVIDEDGLDRTRGPGRVRSAGDDEPELLTGEAAAAARAGARDRGALGAAAMLVGAAARMIDLAVTYAQQREQFGVAIGSFQAVKHHLATALVGVEFARPAVYRAAWSLTHRPDEPATRVHVAMAKVLAGDAALATAKAALQVHGAIGYTSEHDLHLWMRRAWSLNASYGTPDDHRAHLRHTLLP